MSSAAGRSSGDDIETLHADATLPAEAAWGDTRELISRCREARDRFRQAAAEFGTEAVCARFGLQGLSVVVSEGSMSDDLKPNRVVLRAVLDVVCPRCKAAAKDPCRTDEGVQRRTPHMSRVREATLAASAARSSGRPNGR